MKKILYLFVALLMIGVASSQAQTTQPIRWRLAVKMTSPTEGVITVKALVADGWHLYGTDLPKGGPKPTSFDFSGCTGIKLIGTPVPSEKPVKKEDAQFGTTLEQWEKNVQFTQKFVLTGDRAAAKVSVAVKFMGCNDVTCLPPSDSHLSTAVPAFKK